MIYVNGASWSQRTPLVDTPDIWPSIVAQKIGQDLVNEAVGCAGNRRILECVENLYLQGTNPDYILLGLTPAERECIPTKEMGRWNVAGGYARLEVTGENDEFMAKWWTANCYDPLESIYQYYKVLWKIHMICSKFKCPYLMFQLWGSDFAVDDILGGEEKLDNFLDRYYSNRNAHFRLVYRRAFLALAEERKSWNYVERPLELAVDEMDETEHPLHIGHQKLADFVLQHMKV